MIIAVPISACFTTSLDLDVELAAAKESRIQAIAGVKSGIIRAGQTVTWRTVQFGIPIFHTSLISRYQEPVYFQDSMIDGIFANFEHDHFFCQQPDGTTSMRDEMRFSMPVYLLGKLEQFTYRYTVRFFSRGLFVLIVERWRARTVTIYGGSC